VGQPIAAQGAIETGVADMAVIVVIPTVVAAPLRLPKARTD